MYNFFKKSFDKAKLFLCSFQVISDYIETTVNLLNNFYNNAVGSFNNLLCVTTNNNNTSIEKCINQQGASVHFEKVTVSIESVNQINLNFFIYCNDVGTGQFELSQLPRYKNHLESNNIGQNVNSNTASLQQQESTVTDTNKVSLKKPQMYV